MSPIYSINQKKTIRNDVLTENIVDDVKGRINDIKELYQQWAKVSKSFVKHKWIYRYIENDRQKEMLQKYYDMLREQDISYGQYRRAFKFICHFFGLPNDKVIIENMVFKHDTQDKEQEIIALKYSKGLAKVKIPPNVQLTHVSPADDIDELIPSFRSKVAGKYMYPSKRCFFTVLKDIKPTQVGLEKTKVTKYATKDHYDYAYIDPTYADFKDCSVYIETEKPIPVEKFKNKMFRIFDKDEKNKQEQENIDEQVVITEGFKEFVDLIKNWKTTNQDHAKKVFKSNSLTDEEFEKLSSIVKTLRDPETSYDEYIKTFNKLCYFIHTVPRGVIITKTLLKKGKNGNDNSCYIEYSWNVKKIKLPKDTILYHMSKIGGIKELIPTFRGKSEKGYLYDKPRIYFSITNKMPKFLADYKANERMYRYKCKEDIEDVYVDPLVYSPIQGAVYIETKKPVPVESIDKE